MAQTAVALNVIRPEGPMKRWLAALRPPERNEPVGYLFILPYLVCFLVFMVMPTLGGLYVSFTNWGGLSVGKFIGLQNYIEALHSDIIWQTVRNTLYYTLLFVPAVTAFGLGIAVFVNRKLMGYALARVCFYSPYVMSVTVTGLLWIWLLDRQSGVLNYYISQLLGLGAAKIDWLTSTDMAMPAIVIATVWWLIGFQMVILLAGLQDIPVELYEAATIDGANGWQSFWSITLPLLKPSLTFVIITNVIGSLRVFGQMFIMTQGGPAGATTSVVLQIYNSGFQSFRFGYSASISFLLFAGILVFTILQLKMFRFGTTPY
jgi:multiple sugar transport system permease protein